MKAGYVRGFPLKKVTALLIAAAVLILCLPMAVFADNVRTVNTTSGYELRLEDSALLIDESEIEGIVEAMRAVTAYGNAGFYTTDYVSGDTESLAKSVYYDWFGRESGVLFVIDMDNRNLWIWSDGAANKVITKEWADIITDNVYKEASAGRYGDCAREAFEQIATRLEGGTIANPLKIGTGLFLAVIVALTINLMILLSQQKKKQNPDINLPLIGAISTFALVNGEKKYLRKTRSRIESGSSGGGFSGGGGGGGFSGGGGGGGGGSGGGHGF